MLLYITTYLETYELVHMIQIVVAHCDLCLCKYMLQYADNDVALKQAIIVTQSLDGFDILMLWMILLC